jgi:hypothetical protein
MNSTFSQEQIAASTQAVTHFQSGTYSWGILLAQMQSGKTDTYLLIACKLLELKLVENVVIFSGNAETDLCEQLYENVKEKQRNVKNPKDKKSSFWPKFLQSKEESLASVPEEYRQLTLDGIKAGWKNKISVVWGTELNQYSGPIENTLFIWEEAHFAQNITQRPDKFLRKIGISANGNSNDLKRNKNLVLSVSATPFSELSDFHHMKQTKFVVKMEPGAGYISVKQIRDSGRLFGYKELDHGLRKAFALHDPASGNKWAVIRVSKKNEDQVKDHCIMAGWRFVVHDSVSKDRDEGRKAWESMSKPPKMMNTAILIRGMCRMGKNMEKKHLLFVFETAKASSTDTVLQGLLGRTCGYSEGSDRINVFVHENILKKKRNQDGKERSEIDRYIELWDTQGVQILPKKGNNLEKKKGSDLNLKPIIPIKIKRSDMNNERMHVIADVKKAFIQEQNRIQNKNGSLSDFSQFSSIQVFYLDDSKKHRNSELANKIQNQFENGIAQNLGSGCGNIENEVTIWCPKKIPNFDNSYLYVMYQVKLSPEEIKRSKGDNDKISYTTKREIFAYAKENGIDQESNGGFTILLSPETAIYEDVMLDELSFLVKLSNENQGKKPSFPSSIDSCYDANNNEFKGILVNNIVLESLEHGKIAEEINKKFHKTLKIEKATTISKELADNGFARLMSINW